jgi:hypothetical protein
MPHAGETPGVIGFLVFVRYMLCHVGETPCVICHQSPLSRRVNLPVTRSLEGPSGMLP